MSARKELLELDTNRREIVSEAKRLSDFLTKYPKVVDDEGYPLADIPHHEIADSKSKLERLKYDYKEISQRIEALMPQAFSDNAGHTN